MAIYLNMTPGRDRHAVESIYVLNSIDSDEDVKYESPSNSLK